MTGLPAFAAAASISSTGLPTAAGQRGGVDHHQPVDVVGLSAAPIAAA